MARKKKLFLGTKSIGGPSMKSRRLARRVTSQYHNLRQTLATLEHSNDLSKDEKKAEIKKVKDQIEAIGGINKYQEASVISTQHFQTSKWILQTLRRLNFLSSSSTNTTNATGEEEDNEEDEPEIIPSSGSEKKLKTLEVGAINGQLSASNQLEVRAIDINARLPCIEECDFFTIIPKAEYDVIVCSMVINCVFDPAKRVEMIGRLNMQLSTNGVLFLILPKRCLDNSNMRGSDQFVKLLDICGLELLEEPHFTPRLAFYILRRKQSVLNKGLKKLLGSDSFLQSEENSIETGTWSKIVQGIVKASTDEDTKKYFSRSELNIDEFCLKFPAKWL